MIRLNGDTVVHELPTTLSVCGRTYRSERLYEAGETEHEGTLSSPADSPRTGTPLAEVRQVSLFAAVTVAAIITGGGLP